MGSLLFIKKEGFQLPREKKVLKAGDFQVYLEAEEIVGKARIEARRILEEAKKEYAAQKKKGYQAGIKQGKINISQQMVDTVNRTVDYLASVEEKVTDIVMTALRKVIGEVDDRELIRRVVGNALSVVRDQKEVTLRVSPKEVETVKKSLNTITADFPAIGFIDVVGDQRLKPGGCILETEIGDVDASVGVQLEAIRRSLTKKLERKKA
jgi:type III secretion protein L